MNSGVTDGIVIVIVIAIIAIVFVWVHRSTNKDEAIRKTKEETIEETIGIPMTVWDLIKNYTGDAPFQVTGVYKNFLFAPFKRKDDNSISIFVIKFEDRKVLENVEPGFFTVRIDDNKKVKLTKVET